MASNVHKHKKTANKQRCINRRILQSQIGENGVSLENMGNVENMEKIELR